MVRFMWAVRTAFNDKKKRWIFVGVLAASMILLYFAPYCLFCLDANNTGFFISLFDLSAEKLQEYQAFEISMLSVFSSRLFPLAFFLIALVGAGLSCKFKAAVVCAIPLSVCAIVYAAIYMELSVQWRPWLVYAAFYIIFALLVILFVVFLLLSLYLPLKEPAPRPERPKRERKPTKSERIAELERQVAALRGKEKDEA